MKKLTTLLFCCFSFAIYAQVYISGVVYDIDNNPLEGASVYINNTSIGTTTNNKGEFSLNLPKGIYQLVVSYVGFQSRQYSLNTDTYKNPIILKLTPKNEVLDEVVITRRKKISNSKRKAYLRKFKKAFIGESKFASNCKILNKQVIDFSVDPKTNAFVVEASEPLKILNPKLGYIIYYDLKYFKMTLQSVSYFGYSRFDKIDELKHLEETWIKNRFEAYHGSKMHFLRSVIQEKSLEEGYTVDLIERILNPKRPPQKEIIAAKKFLKKHGGLQRNSYKSTNMLDGKIAEAQYTLEQSKLPEYIDNLIEANAEVRKYALMHEGNVYLQFANFLRITYSKESPDKNYNTENNSFRYQVSMISLYNKHAQVLKSGVFKRPFDVFTEGYWAFEKVGDLLPLNYRPDSQW